MYTIEDFRKGQRVQLHPATDHWMMGARYGDVRRVGKHSIVVKLDHVTTLVRVSPANICEIL